MVSLPITGEGRGEGLLFFFITVQSYDFFLVYASICRFFFELFENNFGVLDSQLFQADFLQLTVDSFVGGRYMGKQKNK